MITAILIPQAEEKATFGKQVKTAGRAMRGLELLVKFLESIVDEEVLTRQTEKVFSSSC